MRSPYADLPSRQFWRTGIAEQRAPVIEGLYRKKFAVTKDMKVMTAGSCFAQHIGVNMRRRGFSVMDLEPPPRGLDLETAQSFGFSIYSARYGNIYTVRQLLQLAREAFGEVAPAEPVWTRNSRFFDAQRPSAEPDGLATADLVADHRAVHLGKVRTLLETADLMVFTMGLTEGWLHRETGTVFPTAPGTIAGDYDPAIYYFANFDYGSILRDFEDFIAFAKSINPSLKFLITVSPVPLTATFTDQHVLAATTYSKSVLRAVAGKLTADRDDCDYFPSFEIITSSYAKGRYFEDNLRSVTARGVSTVMNTFFTEHDPGDVTCLPQPAPPMAVAVSDDEPGDDVVCEEALLEAFAAKR